MKTIELSAALASAPVQENLKNFAGLDAQNALGLMTPERLAAVAGGKLGVVKKEKPMVENDYFEIACGYGIFIIGSSETGEMQVYAIYGSKQVEKIAGLGTSYKVEKFNEHTIKVICKYKEGAILTKYTFIGI